MIPKELVVFDNTADNVQERLVAELPCNSMYPSPVLVSGENREGNEQTYFVMFS